MLFTNKTTHCFFQPDYCVFVILFIIYSHPYHHWYYILYTFLPLECAPLALFYIRHAHAYTHYISTWRHGSQTAFSSGTNRPLYAGNHHRFRHRTHPTFAWYRPRHRRKRGSTTTHKQAHSITQGWQAESEGSPRTMHTAAGYTTLDTSYTPFLQSVWCETQIFRHMDT